jgi:hypothetical protein
VCYWQILTDVAVLKTADSAVKAEKMLKQALGGLLEKKNELLASIERSKGRVKICKDAVSKLRKQVQAEIEKLVHAIDSIKQIDLQEALIQLEKAHSDRVVSNLRTSIAHAMLQLLGMIAEVDKAYEAVEDSLCAKSQARLYSEVLPISIHSQIISRMTSRCPAFLTIF